MRMTRRTFLASAASASAASASAVPASALAAAKPARRPNIVLILADDLGYGHPGCYGQKLIQTPRIDHMASEGVRFTNAYSGSPVCAPSRCTLMTGLHTGHCRIRGNTSSDGRRVPLEPGDVTVAKVLKGSGYATGIFGKWGLGEDGTSGVPNRQGFDEWFGYLNQSHAHSYYPEFLFENERKVEIEPGTYSHDIFTRKGLDFIRRHRAEPFFLFMAYTIPHARLEPPSDAPYSDRDWPEAERNFASMVGRLDADVGKILDLLDSLGLGRDTFVFFTSDNGPHSEGGADAAFFRGSGHLRGMKRDLYEGGVRVPMIVRCPGRVLERRVSHSPWAFWDFLPTARHIAGADAPLDLDGVSMLPAITGRSEAGHPPFYWEFHENGFRQGVRSGFWKAVRHGGKGSPLELYELSSDPSETRDAAARHPQTAEYMESLMEQMRTPSRDWPGPGTL